MRIRKILFAVLFGSALAVTFHHNVAFADDTPVPMPCDPDSDCGPVPVEPPGCDTCAPGPAPDPGTAPGGPIEQDPNPDPGF